MLEYRCLARTYVERTYPKAADYPMVCPPWKRCLVYSRSILSHTSTDIWHRFKFQWPMFTTYKFHENATSCISQNFQSVFAHLISSCYKLHIKVWIAKIELFLRFQYQCVRKENDSLSTPPPFSLSLSLSLSFSLSLSLSLHLINYYVIYNLSLFSEAFIFYGFKFIVECKTSF